MGPGAVGKDRPGAVAHLPLLLFYLMWLSSRSRTGGTPARAQVPLWFPINGAMCTDTWQVVVESFSLVAHGVTQSNMAPGVAVVCDELAADSLAARPNVIGHLGRSYRAT